MSTNPDIPAKYLACYEDPRATPGFPEDAYPAEKDPEPAFPENVREPKARFKAVYARRNSCVRALSRLQPQDPKSTPLAEQIIFLTEAIDHLEDFYAPIGFIAEPIMDDTMFTTELVFTHVGLLTAKATAFESSFSIYIPIPFKDPQGKEERNAS